MAYLVEAGQSSSIEAVMRLTGALGLRLDIELADPRKREHRPNLSADEVHSAIGEFEARHLRQRGVPIGMDEPYQHYQFAGRADLIAWDIERRAFLHIENRTRFPNFQEMAGAFNNKKSYLGAVIAERARVRNWASETHVMAALWSSEVLHALRLRTESFRALCPDDPEAFGYWWNGQIPPSGKRALFVVVDPLATNRQRAWISLDEALTARPRYRGYSEAASRLAMNGPTAAARSSG